MLTTEALEDPRRLITLSVQRRWPKCLAAQLVTEPIHRRPQLVHRLPCFVEARLTPAFHLLPDHLAHV